jgi:hypothetical protein
LHLSSPPHVSAKRGEGGVLTLSVEAGSRERARQIDAEAVVILAQKVAQRFGTVGASATVLDPAHVAAQTSPTTGRNLLLTTLAGLVIGLALAAALSSGREAVPAVTDPRVERRLQERIDQVSQRERSLAQRAGQLAAREHDLARREEELAAAAAEPEPQAPEPEPEPAPAVSSGAWNVEELERWVDANTAEPMEQVDEWRTYLFFLRQHAAADGSLPPQFDGLIQDVFGDLARD